MGVEWAEEWAEEWAAVSGSTDIVRVAQNNLGDCHSTTSLPRPYTSLPSVRPWPPPLLSVNIQRSVPPPIAPPAVRGLPPAARGLPRCSLTVSDSPCCAPAVNGLPPPSVAC